MIAIKGTEMPKSCLDCPISHEDKVVDYICTKTGKNVYLYANEVHPNCPLVEIVTCKDCIKGQRECSNSKKYCMWTGRITEDDFYCKDGKRLTIKESQ